MFKDEIPVAKITDPLHAALSYKRHCIENSLNYASKWCKYGLMDTSLMPNSVGVYAIFHEKSLLYIGCSSMIQVRINQHVRQIIQRTHLKESWPEFSALYSVKIRWNESQGDHNKREVLMIRKLKPPKNSNLYAKIYENRCSVHLKNAFDQALLLEGISMREFADRNGVCPTKFSHWRTGRNRLTIEIKRVILHGWEGEAIPMVLLDAYIKDEMNNMKVEYEIKIEEK